VSRTTLAKKGLELFVKTGRLLPQVEFILVGKWIDDSIGYLRTIASSNVRFLDEIDQERLFALMSKSKVYVQVSRHESFGCALAEAMLCECIPVVSRFAALPEVVGDCGFYLTDADPEKLAVLIRKALKSDPEFGRRARERIINFFPLEKREKELLEIVEGVRD
jgi:glycosyltransferase involved in cell wall biosynthesis